MAKLILEADRIRKTYGDRTVLDIDQIRIYDGERIALIGENGAGKSTLLSILAGETEPDEGIVRRRGGLAVIHQSGQAQHDGSAHVAAQFRAPESREGLSGGEMTRRRISEALSAGTPLLLADEPTTDLDAGGVQLLREMLSSYFGALVLVSHDRDLLDALCSRVWHLEDGRITDFPGSYADYREELKRRRDFQQFEYDRYRSEQTRLKALAQQKAEWAASVKKAPKRMGNSEARLHTHEYTNSVLQLSAAKKTVEDRLNRLEKKERPRDLPSIRMTLGAGHAIESKTALTAQIGSLRIGERTLISDSRFVLPTKSKTALLGENGSGKTTLMRVLRGRTAEQLHFTGDVRVNPGVRMGWFDQDHAQALSFDDTALENAMFSSILPESEVRTVLARLGLRGDSVFKPVRVLSGGERAKLALARLLVSDVNLLLLDEPTNHLDVFTMEALEKLLKGYGGTLLFVSHDRRFVSSVAGRVLSLENGKVTEFEGTLSQMNESLNRDRSLEGLKLQITTLQMRLSLLAARLSAPQKGDRPEMLNAEYEALSEELRSARQKLKTEK